MYKKEKKEGKSKTNKEPIPKFIMMRKFGLDEGQLYVEQCTLLEPNNFIPSWESGGEEKKEVSLALKKLREKYDDIHMATLHKDMDLELIQKGVKKITEEERQVEKLTGGNQGEIAKNTMSLEEVKTQHEEQQLFKQTYEHMLKRMKKDLIALQLVSNDLAESLRSKQQIYKEEFEKQRLAKEHKLQSKYRLDNLMQNIEHEQKKRQERIMSLTTSIKNKEEALQKRMDRVKRQSEIAEAAAGENKDLNEIELRANFNVQRLWCAFLKKKMENEMKKFHKLEEAFQKIRTSTGNSDVQEMVTKFLTREQTYATLLGAVSENEKKLDRLRRENDSKTELLQALKLDLDNQQGDTKMSAEGQEIIQLHKDIQQLQKDKEIINNRKKNINLVCDQVNGWSRKVGNKLAVQLNAQTMHREGQERSMSELFANITEVVNDKLQDIIQKKQTQMINGDRDGPDMQTDEMDMDFASQEFIDKNIRVRPSSGITTLDRDEQRSEYQGHTMKGGDGQDDAIKFEQDALIEMNQDRNKLKTKLDMQIQEKQKLQQMAEDKLKKKKDKS